MNSLIKIAAIVLPLSISVCLPSCTTVVTTPARQPVKKDNGNHYGWYKNVNNPHNPANQNRTGPPQKATPGHGNPGHGKKK